MTKFISIGRYRQSGSTPLEYLLTGAPSLLACGKVADIRGPQMRVLGFVCVGNPLRHAPFGAF